MKAMKNYHNLYLNCDVLLLYDVFEKCRNNNLNNYGLCPSHYLTAPILSWDEILNMKKVEFKLIPDRDICLFFKNCMIGGVFYISGNIVKPTTSI